MILAALAVLASLLLPSRANGNPSASANDGGAPAPSVGGCVETIPSGVKRPVVKESFPSRGMSGYAVTLTVAVEHGKGETVLPHGLELQSSSEAAKELKSAGFALPDQSGSAAARVTPEGDDAGDRVVTKLELPLLALPPQPGRQLLVLPPFPIAISRASGEVMTLCTRPHPVRIDDPTASEPEAAPRANPAPRPQREEWTALKRAVQILAAGLVLGALLAYLLHRWLTRPKPAPPPPPPRPPWEVALERLDEVRHAGLLDRARFAEYFDRVNDTVRQYLGARYGFDGLESTTAEILRVLERASTHGVTHGELSTFLGDCDLVKFANVTPTPEDCTRILAAGESIVRSTMPRRAFPEAPPPDAASPTEGASS